MTRRLCVECGAIIEGSRSRCAICQARAWARWRERRPTGSRWARLRARVLERDAWTCGRCGAPATEVHHIVPWAQGGSDDEANLVSVCHQCHQQLTRAQRRGASDVRDG
jgi:5-methylcytosine-specific restriction endonuclease McrA